MNKYLAMTTASVLIAASALVGVSLAYAQTATMPVLYNQNGAAVNTGSGSLNAGYYYIGGGQAQGGHQVYYYGNGTYYDATTQTYGGSVSDPNGTAGVSLGYVTSGTAPGLPNTGLAGNAPSNWLILLISGAIAAAGIAYFSLYHRVSFR